MAVTDDELVCVQYSVNTLLAGLYDASWIEWLISYDEVPLCRFVLRNEYTRARFDIKLWRVPALGPGLNC